MKKDALVLYKQVPARIREILSDKIVILLPDGKEKKVRSKDIQILHPGPITSLPDGSAPVSQVEEAGNCFRVNHPVFRNWQNWLLVIIILKRPGVLFFY